MSFLDSIILGVIQGLTEFLPVSSSGHLVLGQHVLGLHLPGNLLEIVMHLGTLMSILVVFWRDIFSLLSSLEDKKTKKYILILIVGSIPAAFVGIFFKEELSGLFDSITAVGINLIITGIVLWTTKYIQKLDRPICIKNGFIIGLAQACAILPGISRSGATISTALILKVSQEEAFKYSFLLAIPALVGAGIITSLDNIQTHQVADNLLPLAAGFLSSFIVGWIALKWLITLLKQGQFHWFGVYCLVVGILITVFI